MIKVLCELLKCIMCFALDVIFFWPFIDDTVGHASIKMQSHLQKYNRENNVERQCRKRCETKQNQKKCLDIFVVLT